MQINCCGNIVKIKDLWINLINKNNTLSFYQLYEWNFLQEQNFKGCKKLKYRNSELLYVIVDDLIIFPLVINHVKQTIYFLGQDEASDYLSPVFGQEFPEYQAIIGFKYLKNKYRGFKLCFDRINEANPFFAFLQLYHDNKKNEALIQKECVLIHTHTETKDFYSSLSKSSKQNYRTAKNRLTNDNLSYEVEILENTTLNKKMATTLYSLYRKRRDECDNVSIFKSRLQKLCKRILFCLNLYKKKDVLTEFSIHNEVFVSTIKIGGNIAAFCEGHIEKNSRITVSRVATNALYYYYSPGQILLVDTIEAIKEKYDVFDLTRGTEEYKFKLGGIIHNNYCCNIFL